ncbi:MAG: response regulator transcription factor [Lachnospiraceae bacterium]|jgi:DNA-binding response OmpR family regulator
MTRILLVEDDELIAGIVKYHLEKKGYDITWAQDGDQALNYPPGNFNVILLDILLPDINGIDLCQLLRAGQNIPIIFTSCMDDTETIVQALQRGGDDFLVKPFDMNVLVARIEANLRRIKMDREEEKQIVLKCGDFVLNVQQHTLQKDKELITLSIMEVRILSFFMNNPNQYFTAHELYTKIWGRDSLGDVRTVQVHIHNLRKKIEKNPTVPTYLTNEWGKGYCFCPEFHWVNP